METNFKIFSIVNSGTSQVVRQVQVVVIPSSEEQPECQVESSIDFSGDNVICADGYGGRHYCYVSFTRCSIFDIMLT